MKIKRIVYTLILSIVIITLVNPKLCFAARKPLLHEVDGSGYTEEEYEDVDTPIEGNDDIGLPTLDESFKPTASLGSASSMVSTILSILIVLGIVATVIGIALIGFGSILGSASEKAEAQTKIVGIVVAGILITSGCSIAKILISIAEKI